MIIKLIGAVLVIFSSSYIGLFYAKFDKKRIRQLQEMKKALTILSGEIQFSYSPIPQAFTNISVRVGEPISSLFSHIVILLSERRPASLSSIWDEALTDCFKNSYFITDDMEAFKSFGTTLGFLDKDMQVSSISLVLDYIDNKDNELNLLCAKNSKLYQSLGLLGGLLIAILLI